MAIGYIKKDYHQALSILGLAAGATDRDIKAAFRAKVLKHHPDRNPGNRDAAEKFRQIRQAYEVLREAAACEGRIPGPESGKAAFVPFCKTSRAKEGELKASALKHDFFQYLREAKDKKTGAATKIAVDTIINLASSYGYDASDELREILTQFCDRKRRESREGSFSELVHTLKQVSALAGRCGFKAEEYCRNIIIEFCRSREKQAGQASIADIKTFVRQIGYLERKFGCSTDSIQKIRTRFIENQAAIKTVSRVIKSTRDRAAKARRRF